ncbi:MAG: hypothetical protein KAW93_07750 [Methanogenium sp.]|nr:hypothetical protein [Methanogenium sp.]
MSNTTQIENRIQKIEERTGKRGPCFCCCATLYQGDKTPEGTVYESREELFAAFAEENQIKAQTIVKLCICDHSEAGLSREIIGYYR